MRFLIVGSNVRNVAESARKAGFEVYALTEHDDADLRIYAREVFLIENKDEKSVRKRALEISESIGAEIITASGYETLFNRKLEIVVNKRKFYRKLENLGIAFPELLSDGEMGILKPEIGGGGEDVRLSDRCEKGYILQRFIDGIPCSASVLSNRREAKAIAVNKMIVGDSRFNASGFKYCGNVTPFKTELEKKLRKIAEELALAFELEGNIGVDFILSDKPYVLEINPRFQGSLDTIEWSSDCNLFKMHLDAINGKLREVKQRRFAGRAILFTDKDLKIRNSPIGNPFFADIPKKGDVYLKGDPLVSILSSGKSESDVVDKLIRRKDLIWGLI